MQDLLSAVCRGHFLKTNQTASTSNTPAKAWFQRNSCPLKASALKMTNTTKVITSCTTFSCTNENGPPYPEYPNRLAGTCKQYSKNAMPQLIKITVNSPHLAQTGLSLKRRCPYQAKVMNVLLNTSRPMVKAPRMARMSGLLRPVLLPAKDKNEPRAVDPYFSPMISPFTDKLPRRGVYLRRQLRFVFAALVFIAVSLAIGVAGYMGFAGLGFTDAFLNASMIMGGMGPVDVLPNAAAKWFASFFALYSGVALLTIVATMLTPTIHRILHIVYLDQQDSK